VATVPDSRPVFLYDHADKEANTVGLLPSHSRIYVTTGLLASMSDEGMRGVIAHENAHVHERHIFATFTYACCFAVSSHLLDNNNFFFAAFLLFLGIRRYCEYRADAGAAAVRRARSDVDGAARAGRVVPLEILGSLVLVRQCLPNLGHADAGRGNRAKGPSVR
jgi:Zn-dependent protease with chaperone function